MTHTRSFDYPDHRDTLARAHASGGLAFLRSIAGADRIQAAPVAQCLDFQLVEVDPGRVVFELTPQAFHYNPIGSVHGGVLATLCDSAAGAAVHSTLEAGETYTSLEIKVSFLRGVTVDSGRLRCEGTVMTRGSRIATSEAKLVDASGKLVAHATSTCLVMSAKTS